MTLKSLTVALAPIPEQGMEDTKYIKQNYDYTY